MRLTFGHFVLDLDQRRLFAADADVHLQPKGYELLKALLEVRPKALSKDDILSRVWPGTFVSENTLAAVVRDLRAALGDDAQEPRFIRTVFGYGYAFVGMAAPLGDGVAAAPASDWYLIHDHREIALRGGVNVLGRSGPDVVVFDSPTVSRHHAAITVEGAQAALEDLGSKNGTWLGVGRVTAAQPLTDGAELRLGSVVVTARRRGRSTTTETVAAQP